MYVFVLDTYMMLSYEKSVDNEPVGNGKRKKRNDAATACRVPLTDGVRANASYMKEKWGCKNNAITSMTLCNAPKDTKITLYDDEELGEQDDYALIEVKENMNGCETISTFEVTKVLGTVDLSYKKNDGLDGNVSSFKVDFGNFSLRYFIPKIVFQ